MRFFLKYQLTIIGLLFGALAGWAYYYFVGCENGSCAITSKPFNSIAYFSILGVLFLNSFKRKNNEN